MFNKILLLFAIFSPLNNSLLLRNGRIRMNMDEPPDDFIKNFLKKQENKVNKERNDNKFKKQQIGIFVNGNLLYNQELLKRFLEGNASGHEEQEQEKEQYYRNGFGNRNNDDDYDDDEEDDKQREREKRKYSVKSKNYEVIYNSPTKFKDIGGYDNIKKELKQCIDILINFKKYSKFNVRLPKGIILEGPPGNGKTLLAKGLAGESNVGFIAVSGSEFQEKYVGVGASRIREMFELAKKNKPCIIFIDEIDALGRARSGDGESSSSERDSTLNELLVSLDGFKDINGVFVVCATNRADLLDSALMRPGRIDKKIFVGSPDSKTRNSIINIHIKGKPYDKSINIGELVENTKGLSGAQIENILNEAMLTALRDNREVMNYQDIEVIMNRVISGWQSSEHEFTKGMIKCIAIHELGHAIVGLCCKHHSKMKKIIINLQSPQTPAYTIFESSTDVIHTKEQLMEHLMVLLSGRIAEEIFYNNSITTGSINDFREATALAEKMILQYGMGDKIIYPSFSDKYKETIDNEVFKLINEAYERSSFILKNSKELILVCSELLLKDNVLNANDILLLIANRFSFILDIQI